MACAVSIALVLSFHAVNAVWNQHRADPSDYDGPWYPLTNGSLGVSIFFGISGFLITHLMLRETEKTGRISLRDFYIRRAFRILPAFYLYLLAIVILQRLHAIHLPTRNIVQACLFVLNYSVGQNWWVGHAWSLSVEEQFYLFWPFLLGLAGVWFGRRAAVAMLLLVPLVRVSELLLLPTKHFLVQQMWETGHTRMDALMFGVVVALFYKSPIYQRFINHIFRLRIHWAAFLFLFVVSPYLFLRWRDTYLYVAGFSLEGASVMLLLIWAVQNANSPVGKVLNSRPMVHIGSISYSLYLWQQLFLIQLNTTWTGRLPLSIACALAMAELSHYCVERPFLHLREYLTGEKTRVAAAKPLRTSLDAVKPIATG